MSILSRALRKITAADKFPAEIVPASPQEILKQANQFTGEGEIGVLGFDWGDWIVQFGVDKDKWYANFYKPSTDEQGLYYESKNKEITIRKLDQEMRRLQSQ